MNEPKSRKGQQTRELLLQVALKQFTTHGFHGTAMRQIAEEAGLAVGGIYNHFANKDEMLKAVIIRYHPLNIIVAELARAHGASVETLLRDVTRRLYTSLKAEPALLKLLFIEVVECQGRHLPELLKALLPSIAAFAQELPAVEGQLRPLPPLAVIRLLFSTLLGFFISETMLADVPLISGQIGTFDDYLDVFLHGILHDDAHRYPTVQ